MIVMERFVFWGAMQRAVPDLELYPVECPNRIFDIDRDGRNWLEKGEVMEDHLPKEVIMESLCKGYCWKR